MAEYSVKKSTMERYDIRLKNNWRCSWAIISISEDGVFHAHTDCGDFSYSWNSFGDCFKSFLIDIMSRDPSYLYNKIHSRERAGKVDVKETINNMKRRIIENRIEGGLHPILPNELTREEARNLWDELDDIQKNYDELSMDAFATMFYEGLSGVSKERGKVFHDEEIWYGDLIVTTVDRQAEAFCSEVAPVFAEILKNELDAKKEVVNA